MNEIAVIKWLMAQLIGQRLREWIDREFSNSMLKEWLNNIEGWNKEYID